MIKQKLIIEFLQDLTDIQKVILMYHCLGLSPIVIAETMKVSRQRVNQCFIEIMNKKNHDEIIADLQEAICRRGLFLDNVDHSRRRGKINKDES
jgi:uncharacterized ubiquitin-like protein YukD